ncbi:hypothetical protein LUU34_01024500 [Aix galericulata]|nr:hypothetical protein LUU34_01024500 [Aix galericulata]
MNSKRGSARFTPRGQAGVVLRLSPAAPTLLPAAGLGAVSLRARGSADGAVPRRPPLPLRGLRSGAGSREPPGGGSVRTRRRLRGGRGEGKRRGGERSPAVVYRGGESRGRSRRAQPGLLRAPPSRGCCAGPRGSARCCCCCCCWPPPGEQRVSGGFVGGWARGDFGDGVRGEGCPAVPAYPACSPRRVPPRRRRVLPREPERGLRGSPVPQLGAGGAERARRRAPGSRRGSQQLQEPRRRRRALVLRPRCRWGPREETLRHRPVPRCYCYHSPSPYSRG